MFWFNHGKGIYFSYNTAHSVDFIICNNQKKQTYSGLSFNTNNVSSQHIAMTAKNQNAGFMHKNVSICKLENLRENRQTTRKIQPAR